MVGVETRRGWEVVIDVEDSSAVTGFNHLLFTIHHLLIFLCEVKTRLCRDRWYKFAM